MTGLSPSSSAVGPARAEGAVARRPVAPLHHATVPAAAHRCFSIPILLNLTRMEHP